MKKNDYAKELIDALNKINVNKSAKVELIRKNYLIKLTYDDVEYIITISTNLKEIYEVSPKNHKPTLEEFKKIIWNEFMCGNLDLN